ncbi:entericidin A/B family lipoprotein [Cognatishimia sp. SS12]|nr:entericidin A/B family lipoprotein [Cognatishimia sp. SS12]MDC0737865.1 entericidin A/B family lipoprotein [Cognatishimia sp. SS12]
MLRAFVIMFALMGVTACETIEGFGQDVENTGEAIQAGAN